MTKKQWTAPVLNVYSSIEHLTQMNGTEMIQGAQFMLPGQGFGLLASLEI